MSALALDYLVALYRRHGGQSATRTAEKIEGHRRQKYGATPTKQERDKLSRFMARRHKWARANG